MGYLQVRSDGSIEMNLDESSAGKELYFMAEIGLAEGVRLAALTTPALPGSATT